MCSVELKVVKTFLLFLTCWELSVVLISRSEGAAGEKQHFCLLRKVNLSMKMRSENGLELNAVCFVLKVYWQNVASEATQRFQ